MKSIWYKFSALTVVIFAFVTSAVAADISIGQHDFNNNCSECHGEDGKGHGWLTQFLNVSVPLLTNLKRNNGGVFPVERVSKIIDGREEIKIHGSRMMPVWGSTYMTQSDANDPLFSKYQAERIIHARILSLIDYLSQIQE